MSEYVNAAKERSYDFIYGKKSVIIDHLILLALAFIPFWRMAPTGIWNIHDQNFPLYPIERFLNSLYFWNHYLGTGYPDPVSILSIWPVNLMRAAFTYGGMPVNIVQRFLLISALVLTGWGMYYLVNSVFSYQNQAVRRVACITASIFYMMNPVVIYWLFLGAYPQLSLVVLPFTFTFVFKGLNASKEGGDWVKYAILTAFSSTLLLTSHPEVTVLIAIFFTLYLVCHILYNLYACRVHILTNLFKFSLITALVSFILNLYWLLPTLYTLTLRIEVIQFGAFERLKGFAEYPLISLQVMRLQLFKFSQSYPLTAGHQWIVSSLSILIGLTLFCLMSLSFLLKLKDKHVYFFMFTTLISIGFATGLNPPFGPIYLWLWNRFAILRVLSDPQKLLHIAVFGYSILLGISATEFYKRLSNRERTAKRLGKRVLSKAFVCAVIFLILINSYPLLSGNLYGILEPMHVPRYYIEAREWLRQQNGDFRIMMIPQMPGGIGTLYTWAPRNPWNPYYMVLFSTNVFPVPVLDWMVGEWFASPKLHQSGLFVRHIYDSILNNKTMYVGRMLSLLTVKYIVVSDDIAEPGNGNKVDTTGIKSILQNQKDMRLMKNFGELNFYENKAYRDNLIYGTATYIVIPEPAWEILLQLCNNDDKFHPSQLAIFSSQQLPEVEAIIDRAINIDYEVKLSNDLFFKESNIQITYKRINPTEYVVKVNTDKPFILVFSESYDPDWKAKIEGNKSDEPKHFIVNFYANGWYIDKTGELIITLEYESQKYFDLGMMASVTSAIALITFLATQRLLKRFKR